MNKITDLLANLLLPVRQCVDVVVHARVLVIGHGSPSSTPSLARMTAMSKLRIHNFSVSLDGYIRLAGGASAIQQYLRAGLVDEMHLAYAPVLLGSGERLFDDLADAPSGYQVAEFVGTPAALHVRFVRKN
jgi:dihydrofolate reductase